VVTVLTPAVDVVEQPVVCGVHVTQSRVYTVVEKPNHAVTEQHTIIIIIIITILKLMLGY
jgi:hypothetical protein